MDWDPAVGPETMATAAEISGTGDGGCSRHTGHLWSVSLYGLEVNADERDDLAPYVWALFELAFYDYDRNSNGALYASMEFSHAELSAERSLFPPLSRRQALECAHAADRTAMAMRTQPLCENLGEILAPSVANQHSIQVLTGKLLYAVRRRFGLPGFYEPAEFSVSRASGLLTAATRIECTTSKVTASPSFAGLNASVSFDADAVAATTSPRYAGDPRALGLERLKAVVRGKLRPSRTEIEWLWPATNRGGNSATAPAASSSTAEAVRWFFLTRETAVSGPSWWKQGSRVTVASVLPRSVEAVVVPAESFSCMGLFAAFLQLYRCFYLQQGAPCSRHVRRPLVLAQFPVFDCRPLTAQQQQQQQRQEAAATDSDHETQKSSSAAARGRPKPNFLYMPGFPCLPCVSISASSEGMDRATAACRASSLAENLWPAYGIRALHMLDRRRERRGGRCRRPLTREMASSLETYPAGTIFCAAGAPMIFSDCRLARFDFTAFYPCLYAAYAGDGESGLVRILQERIEGRNGSGDLKIALVAMFGGLKYVDPDAYKFVIGAANVIARAVERTANRLGFGVAAYVKDGFFGVFDPDSRTDVERLRYECELAANAALARVTEDVNGTGSAPPVRLRLRTEGAYTDGLLINANKYWLYDAGSDEAFVCGVIGGNCRGGLSEETRSAVSDVLKKIKVSAKNLDDVEAIVKSRVDDWLYAAFERRGDVEFWTEVNPGGKDFLIPEEIRANTAGKLESADACLGGDVGYVFIPQTTPEAKAAKGQCPAAAFPCSLAAETFCLKINYEAHLSVRLESILAWSRAYAWLRFRNHIVPSPGEDETDAQAREMARISYNYDEVAFLFA